jgi:hypothetical protein
MKYDKWATIVAAVLMVSCADKQPRQHYASSYANAVLSRPMPAGDEQRTQECNWVRSEIARQQGLAAAGFTMATSLHMAATNRAVAQENIVALESRAANVQCNAAFSNAPAASSGTRLDVDACMAKCQQYTERTKEQCFDACNK